MHLRKRGRNNLAVSDCGHINNGDGDVVLIVGGDHVLLLWVLLVKVMIILW